MFRESMLIRLVVVAFALGFQTLGLSDQKSGRGGNSADDSRASLYSRHFEPLIEAGYKPELDTDEGGLWQAMDRYEKELQKSALLVDDPELSAYLHGLVCKLAPEHCADIRVYVSNNPYFNASMAPNGVMLIWSGLLLRVDNEAQLASVIGHELAHYLQKHSLTQWRRAKSTAATQGVLVAVGNLAGGLGGAIGALFADGLTAGFFSFSREQESEADIYGLQLLDRAGYDTRQAGMVWKTVIEEDESSLHKGKKGGWLSSHPLPDNRMEQLSRQAEVVEFFTDEERATNRDEYYEVLSAHYKPMMERLIKAKLFGRIRYLLDRHENSSLPRGVYHYFAGEYFRGAGEHADYMKAIAAYEQSIANDGPAESYRGAGYAALKLKDSERASVFFKQYLSAAPEASDRAMIEFYITE